MSDAEALRYLRWTNATSCSVSYDFGGRVLTYNKVTAIDGQKTVCMDAGVRPEPNRCVVYSFGINNDWSFDDMFGKVPIANPLHKASFFRPTSASLGFLGFFSRKYGCDVYAFDPSMNVKDHRRSKRVLFYQTGLGTKDHLDEKRGWNIRALSSLYEVRLFPHTIPISF